MLIQGLQKLTLLDFPGRVACTVFTGGCNFRCPYCHNASLVLPQRMTPPEDLEALFSFLKKRRGVLDGVAVTGGEPLIHGDMAEFLGRIRELGFEIKLDTNGAFPERLAELIGAGLVDRVAMDIKNSPELYNQTAGVGVRMEDLARSRDLLMEGKVEYEFRTTVVRGLHTQESIAGAAKWIAGAKEYYLQQYRDSGDIICPDGLDAFSEDEMKQLAETAAQYVPSVQLRGI